MTPRERTLASINHHAPDRIPFSWGFGPTPEMGALLSRQLADNGIAWARLMDATNDIVRPAPGYVGPRLSDGVDIWGIRRQEATYGDGAYDEISNYPLASIETIADTSSYGWPSAEWFDYREIVRASNSPNADVARAVCIWGGNPFETYCWMTGLEESMIRMACFPELVMCALDRITTFYEECIRFAVEALGDRIDIIFLADDLGSQNGPLMSAAMYERVIQPFHKRLTSLVHDRLPHAKVMFHTDGDVFDIVPSLIASGVDILEAVQIDCAGMDPVRLKRAYGKDLAFHGAISVQSLLPFGNEADIARTCSSLVRIFGNGGGYVAAPSHAIQVGTPVANVMAMLRSVLGDADYESALALSSL